MAKTQPTKTIEEAANALHIIPSRHVAFARLCLHHLRYSCSHDAYGEGKHAPPTPPTSPDTDRQYPRSPSQEDDQGPLPTPSPTPTPIDLSAITVSFLQTHGPAIWPAYAPHRSHLSVKSTVTTGKNRGLSYAKSSQLAREDRKKWEAAHEGRDSDTEEALVGSLLGRLLRGYFEVLAGTAEEELKKLCIEDSEGVGNGEGEAELLEKVICELSPEENEDLEAKKTLESG